MCVPNITANDPERHVRSQLCCNHRLDTENGIPGCPRLLTSPSWAWRTMRIPERTVRYPLPHLSRTGRDPNTGESHQSPGNSTVVHLAPCAGARACVTEVQDEECSFLPSWDTPLDCPRETLLQPPITHLERDMTAIRIKCNGANKPRRIGCWLGKEGGTRGLWRKVSVSAGF